MKDNNCCPKCNSKDVLKLTRASGIGGSKLQSSTIRIKLGLFKTDYITPTNYLCLECGYIEQWVTRKEDLEIIVKNKDNIESYL